MTNVGSSYITAGRYPEAVAQLKKALEIDANYAPAHLWLAIAYQSQGQYDSWIEECQKYATLSHDPVNIALYDAVKIEYQKAGYRAALKKNAEVQIEQSKTSYVDPAHIAITYGFLGDKEQAFFWLNKGLAEKSDGMEGLKAVHAFDFLRSDPRYTEILRRMNLPQ